MADDRTYIKVHDGIEDHPKTAALTDKAFRLLVTTWAWCSRHHTDGRVPLAAWKKRGTKGARDELVTAGLVETYDRHVLMHDYLEHQRSAAKIEEIKEQRREGGRWGSHKRWHVAEKKHDPECEYCTGAKPPPKGSEPDGSTHGSTDTSAKDLSAGNRGNFSESGALANEEAPPGFVGADARLGHGPSAVTSGLPENGDRSTHRSSSDSPNGPGYPETETETDKDLRDFPSPLPVGDARAHGRGASGPNATAAFNLVRRVLGNQITSNSRTALTIEVTTLLAEATEDEIAAALRRWNQRTGVGVRIIHGLVDDIRKEARGATSRPAATFRESTTDQRVAAAQALKASFATQGATVLQLPSGDHR